MKKEKTIKELFDGAIYNREILAARMGKTTKTIDRWANGARVGSKMEENYLRRYLEKRQKEKK